MKLFDLVEAAAPGVTSVASIGKVEFAAKPHSIDLYKRNSDNCAVCVAKIRRYKGSGWRFVPTKNWSGMNLPHFGNLSFAKTPVNGSKAITGNLESMLKKWGIRHDGLDQIK